MISLLLSTLLVPSSFLMIIEKSVSDENKFATLKKMNAIAKLSYYFKFCFKEYFHTFLALSKLLLISLHELIT